MSKNKSFRPPRQTNGGQAQPPGTMEAPRPQQPPAGPQTMEAPRPGPPPAEKERIMLETSALFPYGQHGTDHKWTPDCARRGCREKSQGVRHIVTPSSARTSALGDHFCPHDGAKLFASGRTEKARQSNHPLQHKIVHYFTGPTAGCPLAAGGKETYKA